MRRYRVGRPSPAMVVSMLALFAALGSGAYAQSRIGTDDIQHRAVTTSKLDRHAVENWKLARRSVGSAKLRNDTVVPRTITDESIGLGKLRPQAITRLQGSRLVDPRDNPAVAGEVDPLSWGRTATIDEVADDADDPIPAVTDGGFWRQIQLDPGVYVLQWTSTTTSGPGSAAATRFFLDGSPAGDAGGYFFTPVSADGEGHSGSTVIAVHGEPGTLAQRLIAIGDEVDYRDNLLITETQLAR